MTEESTPFIPTHGTDEAAKRRTAFGSWASSYQRFRPGYPPELFQYLIERSGLPAQQQHVVDIGAGTGQLTRGFLNAGCAVRAVEPDDRMREVLADSTQLDDVLPGSAEELPIADGTATIVAGAQMWHWVDESRALPEVARVLAPGGLLAIIWSLRDDRVDWVRQLNSHAGLPDSYSYFVDARTPSFGPPFIDEDLTELTYTWPGSPAELVGLVSTFSHVGTSETAAETLAAVEQLTQEHPDLAGKETFDVPYVCKVFTAIRD